MKQFDRDKYRQIMLVRGYTQKELDEKAGVVQGTISAWFTGRSTPSIVLMKRLADALHVDIRELTKDEAIREVVEAPVFREAEAVGMKILAVEKKPEEKKANRDELLCSALEAATELLRIATEILKESRRDEA